MQPTKDKVNKVGVNQFRFSGKISDKKFQFSGAGKTWGTVKVTIPGKEEKFKANFNVKFFGDTAEKGEIELNEGSNYLFYGNIKNGSYMSPKTGQKVWTTDFIVNGWADAVEESVEENVPSFDNNNKSDDDVPF